MQWFLDGNRTDKLYYIYFNLFKLEYAHKQRTFDQKVRQVERADTAMSLVSKMNTEEHLINKIQKSVANRSK